MECDGQRMDFHQRHYSIYTTHATYLIIRQIKAQQSQHERKQEMFYNIFWFVKSQGVDAVHEGFTGTSTISFVSVTCGIFFIFFKHQTENKASGRGAREKKQRECLRALCI